MKRILLVLFALSASLILSELIVRKFVPVRSVGPSFSTYDPFYGKILKKSFAATRITPEFTMRFSTNSHGFRGPEPTSFPDRPILFLGDSFTAGNGVNDGEEFPDLVRKKMEDMHGESAIPVVNAAMGDSGNGRWIRFLKNEGGRYNPRLVVLQVMGNDFRDNLKENFFTLAGDGALVEQPVPRKGFVRTVQSIVDTVPGLSYSYLVGLANQARWALEKKRNLGGPAEELTYRLLEETLSLCKKNRWPVLVISVGIDGERLERTLKIFQREGIAVIRMPGRPERPDLYYTIDGHWNAKGHAVAAELLMIHLEQFELTSDYLSRPGTPNCPALSLRMYSHRGISTAPRLSRWVV